MKTLLLLSSYGDFTIAILVLKKALHQKALHQKTLQQEVLHQHVGPQDIEIIASIHFQPLYDDLLKADPALKLLPIRFEDIKIKHKILGLLTNRHLFSRHSIAELQALKALTVSLGTIPRTWFLEQQRRSSFLSFLLGLKMQAVHQGGNVYDSYAGFVGLDVSLLSFGYRTDKRNDERTNERTDKLIDQHIAKPNDQRNSHVNDHGASHVDAHDTAHGASHVDAHDTAHGASHVDAHDTAHGASHVDVHGTTHGAAISRILILPESRKKSKTLNAAMVNDIAASAIKKGYEVKTAFFRSIPYHTLGEQAVHIHFSDLIQLIQEADLVITADSLPAHLSQYLERPHVVVYPARTNGEWHTPFSRIQHTYTTFNDVHSRLGSVFGAMESANLLKHP